MGSYIVYDPGKPFSNPGWFSDRSPYFGNFFDTQEEVDFWNTFRETDTIIRMAHVMGKLLGAEPEMYHAYLRGSREEEEFSKQALVTPVLTFVDGNGWEILPLTLPVPKETFTITTTTGPKTTYDTTTVGATTVKVIVGSDEPK